MMTIKIKLKRLDELDLLESDRMVIREELQRWIAHKQRIKNRYSRNAMIWKITHAEIMAFKDFLKSDKARILW
jgi:hypothetical protein